MTDATTAESAPPSDYRLLLPEGWFRIPLEVKERERAVSALVERQYAGADNVPHLKQQTREELLNQAQQAHANGGIELYLSLQQHGPIPLSASLLVTLTPPPDESITTVAGLADHLAETSGEETEVTTGELPAGPAVRTRVRREANPEDRLNRDLATTGVDYYIAIPDSRHFLLLSFSTPLDAIADAMAGLFDAIATSLKWRGGGSDGSARGA